MSILREKVGVPLQTWTAWGVGGGAYRQKADTIDPVPWDTETVAPIPHPLPAHVGLWLDRYLVEPDALRKETEAKPGRDALYRAAIEALDDPRSAARRTYQRVFDRFRAVLDQGDPATRRLVVDLEAVTRILLHAATATSVTEGSLLLHHTYGVPYLPGTALKGVARARARKLGRLDPERYERLFRPGATADGSPRVNQASGRDKEPSWVTELFGYVDEGEGGGQGGYVDFWDALWVPVEKGPGSGSPLVRDIVNPHHSAYYTGKDDLWPTPAESPIPTHFLTIRPGTRFRLVLETWHDALAEGWLRFVLDELLRPALEFDGIGARTAAGYGRLRVVDPGRQPG